MKFLRLPAEFALQLNPYVREKYAELWADLEKASSQDSPDA